MGKRDDYLTGDGSELFFPDCNKCKYYLKNNKCFAFPDKGIPNYILEGKKHLKVIPGQKGKYVFKSK
jgi:hypothetical protein